MSGRWFNGPEFLQLQEDFWPVDHGTPDVKEVYKEKRKAQTVYAAAVSESVINCQLLLRVTAYVIRFCRSLRARSCREREDKDVKNGQLNAEEIDRAGEHWVKKAQAGLSTKIAKGDFKTLSPFTDNKGIIRVGGRVDPALVSYYERHATLLPYDHWISMLITRDADQSGHTGIAATTAKTRRRCWIVKGNKLSKIVKRHCTYCRKMEAQVQTQLMAKLPKCRLQPFTPPFMYTSSDYLGPFKVKIGRNKTAKHYGVLFTCLNTRAVH